jgi:hypothetical protein
VTSAAAPEAVAAATFGVYSEQPLTQEDLGINYIYKVGKHHTRAKLDQELNYSTGN